jgi:hypothetical protein
MAPPPSGAAFDERKRGRTRCDPQSTVVFESEDAARAAADQVPEMVTDAVTLESVEVREVVANV